MTSRQILRHPRRQQKGPAALRLDLQGHGAQVAHQLGQAVPVLPGTPRGQERSAAGVVQLEAVEFVVLGQFTQIAQRVVAHLLHREVPQPVGVPRQLEHPVRMLPL